MKALVIAEDGLKIDTAYIAQLTGEEVSLNSANPDGVSIFMCGTPIPEQDWDWVAMLGDCLAEIKPPIDLNLSLDQDPIAQVIEAVMALKEGMVVDESPGD